MTEKIEFRPCIKCGIAPIFMEDSDELYCMVKCPECGMQVTCFSKHHDDRVEGTIEQWAYLCEHRDEIKERMECK